MPAVRYFNLTAESAATGDHLWEVSILVKVRGADLKTTASVSVPSNTRYLQLVGQSMNHAGWRQSFVKDDMSERIRQIRLLASRSGNQDFEVIYSVHASATPLLRSPVLRPLSAAQRELNLASDPLLALDHESVAAEARLLGLGSASQDELLNRIFQRARQLLPSTGSAVHSVPEVLASGRATPLERSLAMIALCRASGMPARLVTGLVLKDSTDLKPHHWLEVYDDTKGWLSFGPRFGYQREVPANYLPLVRNTPEVVAVNGGAGHSIEYSLLSADELLLDSGGEAKDWRQLFDLNRLPLDVRITLATLLLLPLGVLVSTLVRELSGVRSFGTFTPTLFALALSFTDWLTAIVSLSLVLFFGVLGRSGMPGKIRRAPRLTIVISLVSLGIAISVSLMDFFEWNHDGQVVLLPIVILATLVDRIYTTLDEEGLSNAVVRLGWTLLLALICLPVIQYEELGYFLVAYPELHLLTLAMVLVLSRYKGKRLVQVPGFLWLGWPSTRRRAEKEGEADG